MSWITQPFEGNPIRIISTVPSQTELLFDLGLSNQMAGVTRFCVHPSLMPAHVQQIGGTKNLDIQKIISIQPDLIISNKEENEKEQILELSKYFPVWMSDTATVKDAYEAISELGMICRKEEQAQEIIKNLHHAQIEFSGSEFERKKALYLIWRKPWLSVGGDTFIHDMMEHAGFENILKDEKRYPEIDWNYVRNADCEIILLSTEPYAFSERHFSEIRDFVPGVKVILVDGEMFSWYGTRMLKAFPYFFSIRSEL